MVERRKNIKFGLKGMAKLINSNNYEVGENNYSKGLFPRGLSCGKMKMKGE